MPIDPRIARARIEISSDQALVRQLTEADGHDGVPPSKVVQARVNALHRLITANERLIEQLSNRDPR
jgi:hypothetical protein